MTSRPRPRRAPGPVRDARDAEQAAAAAEQTERSHAAAEAVEATLTGLGATPASSSSDTTPEPAAGTVRATVDVPLGHHRRLNRLADDVAEDLAVVSVTRQDLLAAAVAELLERDSFGDELRARITRRVGELQRARE